MLICSYPNIADEWRDRVDLFMLIILYPELLSDRSVG